MAELSTKPYLLRAIHEWCVDNGYCPYIAVVVDERTVVPREFVRNGEIVLNVSAVATNRLQIGNDLVEFEARFGGAARHVSIPVENVSAIFAQENGHGMAFEVAKAPVGGGTQAGEVDEDGEAFGLPGAVTAESDADAPAAAPRRPAKRSRKAAGSSADDAAKGEASTGDAGNAGAPGAASHSRRKPALASVPKREGDDRASAPRAEPRRRAPISAVPSPHDVAPAADRRGAGSGAGATDDDGPETTPPAPKKPRLTRVK